MIAVEICEVARSGKYDWESVGVSGRSRMPLLDAARRLLAAGAAREGDTLGMRRRGALAFDMTGRAGTLAELSVNGTDRFAAYREFDREKSPQ